MKKTFGLLLFLISACAWAQTGAITEYCVLGAKHALTSGLSSSNYMQGVIPQCTVTVYNTGTTTKTTLYQDKSNTPLTNPFTANIDGSILFWAATTQAVDVIGSGGGADPNCTTAPNCYAAPVSLCVDCYPSTYPAVTTLEVTTDPPTVACSSTVNNGVFAVSTSFLLYQCSNNNPGATYAWNPIGPGLPPPTYYAANSAELINAWAAAYSYVVANGVGATIELGPGSYQLSSPAVANSTGWILPEPPVSGVGISLYGAGNNYTKLQLTGNNSGTPWTAFIGSPANVSDQFSLKNFLIDCAPSGSINALYGILAQQIHGDGAVWDSIKVSDCGSAALGGEDIKVGGNPSGSVNLTMRNISTNYYEGWYTGPDGGSGPTPPGAGMHFSDNVGDMVVFGFSARNATTCPLLLDGNYSGDIRVYDAHSYGYDGTVGGNSYNYFSKWGICDYTTHYGATYDSFINPIFDSVTMGGLDDGSSNVELYNPLYYWPINYTFPTSTNLFTVENNAGGAFRLLVTNPVCFLPPYVGVAAPYTNLTTNPISQPVVTGGQGCQEINNSLGWWQTMSPIQVNWDAPNNVYNPGMILDLGTHAAATNYISISGQRMMLGYNSTVQASILQGGTDLTSCVNATFGSGCLEQLTSTYGLRWGGNLSSSATYVLDPSGIEARGVGANITSASTIAPVSPFTMITGNATITTITQPTNICQNSPICKITLYSAGEFSLGSGGNINGSIIVHAGHTIDLEYVGSQSKWAIATSNPVESAVTSATGGSGTGTVTCLTASCTNMSGTYSVAGGTFATGNLLVLAWPTTTSVYKCWTSQNGGVATYGIGHSVATATGMTITAGVSVSGVTVTIDYGCSQY